MTQQGSNVPSFNLWTETWITLEKSDGQLAQVSIRDALLNAKDYIAIYDSSPLVVVGLHRLLAAILQDALKPKENDDLEQFWKNGFPANKIEDFGNRFADRFDLFSPDKPFLQSADLPMFPQTKEEQKQRKTVAKLFSEMPVGTEITHYRHGVEDDCILSPASVALGLLTMPPFMSSGGGGGEFMPSINGAPPPIYVLPGGGNLFENLAASLISEPMLDKYKTPDKDLAWWKRPVPVIVERSKKKGKGMKFSEHKQLSDVGLLHGLTFPSRRVRLHPEKINAICTRSGILSEWCVRTIEFRMGESLLSEDGNWWQDPFVAYKPPSKKDEKKPKTIKWNRDKAAWREFSGLFLQHNMSGALRPYFIDQFAQLSIGEKFAAYPFRCIALIAQADAKKFDWFDFGFDVPPSLLRDFDGANLVETALSFASECCDPQKGKNIKGIKIVFSIAFGKATKNFERFQRLKNRMASDYWAVLANHFRKFVTEVGDHTQWEQALDAWRKTVIREAQNAFDRAADATGDDGATLRHIVEGKSRCHSELTKILNEYQKGG